MNQDIHSYDDIINLPHPTSKKHPPMSLENRAAQFAPFAALTGHKEMVEETQRLTEPKRILDECQKELLDQTIQELLGKHQEHPYIKVIYFIPDLSKEGGSYQTIMQEVRKLDEIERIIEFKDRSKLFLDDIYMIEIIEHQ